MAVMIRLSRQGKKKRPQYEIVATDKTTRRETKFLARFGHYFPKAENDADKVKVDLEAIQAWKARGAQVSETVGQLLKKIAK